MFVYNFRTGNIPMNIEDLGFAIKVMQRPMEALGFEIIGTLPVFKSFEKGAVKNQKEIMDRAF